MVCELYLKSVFIYRSRYLFIFKASRVELQLVTAWSSGLELSRMFSLDVTPESQCKSPKSSVVSILFFKSNTRTRFSCKNSPET